MCVRSSTETAGSLRNSKTRRTPSFVFFLQPCLVCRIKDPKVYPCNQCEKVFAAPSSLSYHRES